jgi:hypothetical protein
MLDYSIKWPLYTLSLFHVHILSMNYQTSWTIQCTKILEGKFRIKNALFTFEAPLDLKVQKNSTQ